nr:glycosyltransferase [Lysobacter chinensis]
MAAGIGVIAIPDVPSPSSWLRENHRRYRAVVVCRYHLARTWFPLLRCLPDRPRLVLDTVDLHHIRELREARVRGNRALARAARRTRKWELAAVRDADTVWVVSPVERKALLDEVPGLSVEVIPNLHESKAGVPPHENRSGILFVGSGRHPPNQDAVDWFVRDILPLVRRKLIGCQAHIVGEGLVPAGAESYGLVVHGHVEDMTPLLESCLVGIAPLRYGAGVKGKINQYMAHGVPVVATTCATEGMQLQDGLDVLEADTASAYADAIIRLHNDPVLWQRLSTGGGINIDRHFSFESALPSIHRTFGTPAAPRT